MRPITVRNHLLLLALAALAPTLAAAALSWRLLDAPTPVALLGAAGSLLVALALSAPVSRRLVTLREHREACARLEARAHAAETREGASREAERIKDEFIAVLGHELRTPLGALAGAAQVLDRLGGDGPARRAVGIVERQVGQMSRLIEDLLDLNRVIRGKVSLSREPLELGELVRGVLREMEMSGRLSRHRVSGELAEAWVRADAARMKQIVTNLVGNAVKYTPEGGSVDVSLRCDRDEAVLRVRDSGVGMSPELAAHAFDLFVQAEAAAQRGGLGIGLALVKRLAELQGGKAFAASAGAGQGSAFTVTLPTTIARADARPDGASGEEAPRRHRILLVEDDGDARAVLVDALSLDGHEVHEAVDGPAALEAVTRVRPDVALVDLGLPGLNGFQLAEALRGRREAEDIVLIALTGFGRPEMLARARQSGFDDLVTKPIAPQALVCLMEVALHAREKRRSAACAA